MGGCRRKAAALVFATSNAMILLAGFPSGMESACLGFGANSSRSKSFSIFQPKRSCGVNEACCVGHYLPCVVYVFSVEIPLVSLSNSLLDWESLRFALHTPSSLDKLKERMLQCAR
jgi:hypothetical protein